MGVCSNVLYAIWANLPFGMDFDRPPGPRILSNQFSGSGEVGPLDHRSTAASAEGNEADRNPGQLEQCLKVQAFCNSLGQ